MSWLTKLIYWIQEKSNDAVICLYIYFSLPLLLHIHWGRFYYASQYFDTVKFLVYIYMCNLKYEFQLIISTFNLNIINMSTRFYHRNKAQYKILFLNKSPKNIIHGNIFITKYLRYQKN